MSLIQVPSFLSPHTTSIAENRMDRWIHTRSTSAALPAVLATGVFRTPLIVDAVYSLQVISKVELADIGAPFPVTLAWGYSALRSLCHRKLENHRQGVQCFPEKVRR